MTLETLLADLELRHKESTQGQWYAHGEGDQVPEATVRTGFYRWLHVTKVDEQYKHLVGLPESDAAYCAAAMNEIPKLIRIIRAQQEALEEIGKAVALDNSILSRPMDNMVLAQEVIAKVEKIANE